MSWYTLINPADIAGDNFPKITNLVREGLNINSRDSRKSTILHQAALMGKIKMVEHLIRLGANVNAKDSQQRTPLHYAMSVQATAMMQMNIMAYTAPALGYFGGVPQYTEEQKQGVKSMADKWKIEIFDCLLKLGADINAKCDTTTSIHEAIRRGKTQAIDALARLGLVGLNIKNFVGGTALMLALQQGQKEVVKHLVCCGADINATYEIVPILHDAVTKGDVAVIELLLEHGALVNDARLCNVTCVHAGLHMPVRDLEMFTCMAELGADFNASFTESWPIHVAIQMQRVDVLDCLLRFGANAAAKSTSKTPIMDALMTNKMVIVDSDFDVVDHLVKCGASINASFTDDGFAIVEAVKTGNAELVEMLVKHGANIAWTGITARNTVPLHLFMFGPDTGMMSFNPTKAMRAFLKFGYDVNQTCDMLPLLHYVVERSDANMLKVLCRLGANVEAMSNRDVNLLDMVLMYKLHTPELAVIKAVIEAGADVNVGNTSRYLTPLQYAVVQMDSHMVRTLVSLGANLESPMSKGMNALHRACITGNVDIVQCVLDKGADVNAKTIQGIQPIVEVLSSGNLDMLTCLLECGANPMIWKSYAVDALYLAVEMGDKDVIYSLIQAGARPDSELQFGALHLDQNALDTAKRIGLTILEVPLTSITTVSKCIMQSGDADLVEMLLAFGANKYGARNFQFLRRFVSEKNWVSFGDLTQKGTGGQFMMKYVHSDLHVACLLGNLDIVRLLIIDGSDVNELDSIGHRAFKTLPLAKYVDYQTLKETATASKVVEDIGYEDSPIVHCQKMESLLDHPGLGNVQSIEYPNVQKLHKDVHRAVSKITETCRVYPFIPVTVRCCGSTAEGTKVCLPDEMDFLAEVASLSSIDQELNLRTAGHDYVYYYGEMSLALKTGSKIFHKNFDPTLNLAAMSQPEHPSYSGRLTIVATALDSLIKDSKRRATSPLMVNWQSEETQVRISIDVVPSIHVDGWPDGAISKTWLMGEDELRKHGYYIVPKPPHVQSSLAREYSKKDLQDLWKVSFAHLETHHMQHLEKRVKDVYLLAKCLKNPDVCRIMVTDEGSYPKSADKFISSYMLKMVFFKNVEYFLNSELSLGEMVCQVYDEVTEGLAKGFIPLYFMPKVNALGGHKLNVPKSAKVAEIMRKFVHALYLRDCQKDECEADVEEVIVYQRKPSSVYRAIEISQPRLG